MTDQRRSCIDCGTKGCDGKGARRPDFCLTDSMPDGLLDESLKHYVDGEEADILRTAATVEHDGYLRWCRVQETVEFAKRMGYRRIGIATCVGLLNESRILARILRSHGFEVFGAGCKAGMVCKTDVGIDPECCEVGQNTCNPVLQAEVLNHEGTELNIMMGLCVGHDSAIPRRRSPPSSPRTGCWRTTPPARCTLRVHTIRGSRATSDFRCGNNEPVLTSECVRGS